MYQILLWIHLLGYVGSISVLSYIVLNMLHRSVPVHAKSATVLIVVLQSVTGGGLYVLGNHTESLLSVCLKSGAFLLLHTVAYTLSRRELQTLK